MKIRCEKCYKELGPQEEFCTSCGAHSELIAKAMKTGDYGRSVKSQLKIDLLIFFFCAFLGFGISSVVISAISYNAHATLFSNTMSLLISGCLACILMILLNLKFLKDFFYNGNDKQLLGSFAAGIFFIGIVNLLSLLLPVTKVIPVEITDYLRSGTATLFSGEINIALIVLAQLLVITTEEILARRILIDTLDDETMLGDLWVVIISAVVGTIMDFAWMMSPETIIISFLINVFAASLYVNTNRSLGYIILFRILIVVANIIIFII